MEITGTRPDLWRLWGGVVSRKIQRWGHLIGASVCSCRHGPMSCPQRQHYLKKCGLSWEKAHFRSISRRRIRKTSLILACVENHQSPLKLCTCVCSALEVIFNIMRSINPRFTYLLTYLHALLCRMRITWLEWGRDGCFYWNTAASSGGVKCWMRGTTTTAGASRLHRWPADQRKGRWTRLHWSPVNNTQYSWLEFDEQTGKIHLHQHFQLLLTKLLTAHN